MLWPSAPIRIVRTGTSCTVLATSWPGTTLRLAVIEFGRCRVEAQFSPIDAMITMETGAVAKGDGGLLFRSPQGGLRLEYDGRGFGIVADLSPEDVETLLGSQGTNPQLQAVIGQELPLV